LPLDLGRCVTKFRYSKSVTGTKEPFPRYQQVNRQKRVSLDSVLSFREETETDSPERGHRASPAKTERLWMDPLTAVTPFPIPNERTMKTLYWLYYDGRPLMSLLTQAGLSDNEVRGIAYARHERIPLPIEGLVPFEVANRIRFSEVRTDGSFPNCT